MASEGPCTVTKINGNDYEVRNNATNNVKSVHCFLSPQFHLLRHIMVYLREVDGKNRSVMP
jgi:hypothetical protein